MPVSLPFDRFGSDEPVSPIILSVPHAGREYPEALQANIRVPLTHLRALEDRYVDLVALDARRDETLFIAKRPRAWIDLNRSEKDRDPRLDDGAQLGGPPLSNKVRAGLGLVPRRAGLSGDFWARRLQDREVSDRIVADHRPYHMALGEALASARARFGIALLFDIHSMPPLGDSATAPRIVIGDLFGKSCAPAVTDNIAAVARAEGVACGTNVPYAGGYILQRHADPTNNIHAVQLEIDRSLYLDDALNGPAAGIIPTAALMRTILDSLLSQLLPMQAQAAE